jgi:hypothetical protein
LPYQFLGSTTVFPWRNKLKREAGWLVVDDAGIISIQVFEYLGSEVIGPADVNPKGVIKPIDSRSLGCIAIDGFPAPLIPAVTVITKRCSRRAF